jgi:uncharacterized protein
MVPPGAEQGDVSAQYNLGMRYKQGKGTPQNYVLAHMWFNLAASQLSDSDKEHRDLAVRNRELLQRKMTPEQVAEAQKLAREWKPEPER